MPMVLLIGGARAGKSALAVRLAARSALPVTFVATAQRGDRDMADRIERHRAERPPGWATVEEPIDLEQAMGAIDVQRAVVLDCLTLWVSNLILEGRTDTHVTELARSVAAVAASRQSPTFVVSNEVGAGVHPATEIGRRFRDLLGRVNTIWSESATEAFLVIAGRTIPLEAEGDRW